jgi:hypothetical protein
MPSFVIFSAYEGSQTVIVALLCDNVQFHVQSPKLLSQHVLRLGLSFKVELIRRKLSEATEVAVNFRFFTLLRQNLLRLCEALNSSR